MKRWRTNDIKWHELAIKECDGLATWPLCQDFIWFYSGVFNFIQETMFCSLSAKLRTWQVVSLATTSQSTLIFSSKRNSYPIMLLTKNVHLFMQKNLLLQKPCSKQTSQDFLHEEYSLSKLQCFPLSKTLLSLSNAGHIYRPKQHNRISSLNVNNALQSLRDHPISCNSISLSNPKSQNCRPFCCSAHGICKADLVCSARTILESTPRTPNVFSTELQIESYKHL